MAIYHLNARGIAPARGSSAIASAAYQSGETLRDEQTGDLKRYARRERVVDAGLVLSENTLAWDRQRLWNEAARAWAGGNQLVAKRYEFALPRELPLAGQRACVLDFCAIFKARGQACDWAMHDDGGNNPHAHVLVSALKLGPEGFEPEREQKSTKVYLCRDKDGNDLFVEARDWKAAKAEGIEKVYNFNDGERRTMSQAEAAGLTKADRKTKTPVAVTAKMDGAHAFDAEKADLKRIRATWAGIANRHLAEHAKRAGEAAQTIDHRSYAECGEAHVPTVHEGSRPAPERVAANVQARALNRAIDRAMAELRQLKERAGAWWAHKADALTRRRQAFIARHTATMRATAARKRSTAQRREVDLALVQAVEAEVRRVFSRRSENHFNELEAALAMRGVVMDFTENNRDLKFSRAGHTVTGAQMGKNLSKLMAMSKAAGRPVTADQLRDMTSEQRTKLERTQDKPADQRPQTIEVEVERPRRGIHLH